VHGSVVLEDPKTLQEYGIEGDGVIQLLLSASKDEHLVSGLRSRFPAVRKAAFEKLGSLEPSELAMYNDWILAGLRDCQESVCVAALRLALKLGPTELAICAPLILNMTILGGSQVLSFFDEVTAALSQIERSKYVESIDQVLSRLQVSWLINQKHNKPFWNRLFVLLQVLEPGELAKYVEKLIAMESVLAGDQHTSVLELLNKLEATDLMPFVAPISARKHVSLGTLYERLENFELRNFRSIEMAKDAQKAIAKLQDPDAEVRAAALEMLSKLETIQIFLKTAEGETFTLDVLPGYTVYSLKLLINHKLQQSNKNMRLSYGGRQLEDFKTLLEYNIEKECTLNVDYQQHV
jgi:ubiquitin-large subunit ribosomal protein L40e